MHTPFRLKKPIGEEFNMDLDDTLNTKNALADVGHMDVPDYGIDEFPDRPMLDGVKSFQREQGLKVDGVMKPDGPTIERLNQVMAERNADQAEIVPKPAELGGTQVAQALPDRSDAGLSAFGLAASILGLKAAQDAQKKAAGPSKGKESPPTNQRTDIAPPTPPLPGFEPPDVELPDRTESLLQPVEVPDLSQPLPKRDKPTIFVFPAPNPGEFGDGIVERKGNEATRKELERIRDYFEQAKGWEHVSGGRYSPLHKLVKEGLKKAGEEQEERHIKGHFKSLKGGHFTDLTFIDDRGRTVHIQSVDVDKNGKPTQRELDNAEKIRNATENEDIFLIPKGAQLKRNQRFQ
jgi:hypothetical protein